MSSISYVPNLIQAISQLSNFESRFPGYLSAILRRNYDGDSIRDLAKQLNQMRDEAYAQAEKDKQLKKATLKKYGKEPSSEFFRRLSQTPHCPACEGQLYDDE